jgi:hypothetical protein
VIEIGSVAGWVTAATSSTLLAVVLGFIIQLRAGNRASRKIEIDADGSLRGDLLGRIRDLEEQASQSQQRLDSALADEKRRCDAELASMRLDFQKQIDGIMRQFLAFQVAIAQGMPPMKRSPEIDGALESLKEQMKGEGK